MCGSVCLCVFASCMVGLWAKYNLPQLHAPRGGNRNIAASTTCAASCICTGTGTSGHAPLTHTHSHTCTQPEAKLPPLYRDELAAIEGAKQGSRGGKRRGAAAAPQAAPAATGGPGGPNGGGPPPGSRGGSRGASRSRIGTAASIASMESAVGGAEWGGG